MKWAVVGIGLVLLTAGTAQAGPIGGVTWNGGEFTVALTNVAGNNYTFVYTADFTDFTGGGHTNYIYGINFKPSSGDVTGFSDFATTAPGTWSNAVVDVNLSANGCSGAGADYFCAEAAIPGALTTGVYTWTFTLALTGVSDPDSLVIGAPIRALFGEYNKNTGVWQSSLMSGTTTVPEPGGLALLGVGLVGLAAKLLRRR
jgi:hypothetical protein